MLLESGLLSRRVFIRNVYYATLEASLTAAISGPRLMLISLIQQRLSQGSDGLPATKVESGSNIRCHGQGSHRTAMPVASRRKQ